MLGCLMIYKTEFPNIALCLNRFRFVYNKLCLSYETGNIDRFDRYVTFCLFKAHTFQKFSRLLSKLRLRLRMMYKQSVWLTVLCFSTFIIIHNNTYRLLSNLNAYIAYRHRLGLGQNNGVWVRILDMVSCSKTKYIFLQTTKYKNFRYVSIFAT